MLYWFRGFLGWSPSVAVAGSGTARVVLAGAVSDFLDVAVVLFAVSAENHF